MSALWLKKRIQGAKEAQEMSLEAKLEFSKSGGPGGSHSRNTSWGFGPLVSDEFGHVKFGWGESLYDGGAKSPEANIRSNRR